MIKIEGRVVIDRCPEEIWGFMANLENIPKWDTGILEARQTSEGPQGLGTTLQAVRQYLGRRVILNGVITEYELNKRAAWKIMSRLGTVLACYMFEPVGGRTQLSKLIEVEFTGFYRLLEPVLRHKTIREERDVDLANIKRLLETQT
jgi:hypothetical protein